ncbi:MAG: hypothetical protein ACI3U1_00630 [Peptococcaceae bacterium]
MDEIQKVDRHLGTWAFLRPGWWIVHIAGIAFIFWLGMWMANGY